MEAAVCEWYAQGVAEEEESEWKRKQGVLGGRVQRDYRKPSRSVWSVHGDITRKGLKSEHGL